MRVVTVEGFPVTLADKHASSVTELSLARAQIVKADFNSLSIYKHWVLAFRGTLYTAFLSDTPVTLGNQASKCLTKNQPIASGKPWLKQRFNLWFKPGFNQRCTYERGYERTFERTYKRGLKHE